MWEAIQKNRFRSNILIGLMGAVLVLLGFFVGMAIDPRSGGALGAILALALWLILFLVAIFQGDQVLLLSMRAREIQKTDAPQLWNVVEEMKIAAGLKVMPKVFIIEEEAPNAFAVGSRPEKAAVAITSGLLRQLDRDELQGVIAHEIGHIANLDIRFMTIASVMLGTIVILSDIFLRGMFYGGRRTGRSRGDPRVQLIILAITLVVAILAPICAQLLYFACSRRREYLADASGTRFTRYPEGLASALEKIALGAASMQTMNRAVAPLCIVNPLQARAAFTLFSTHPPLEERITILRSMGGGAGYVDYEAAYRKVHGAGSRCLGLRTLAAQKSLTARSATPDAQIQEDMAGRSRKVIDLLDRLGSFIAIPCACGIRIKVPPDLQRDSIACTRCGRVHPVPRARQAPAAGTGAGAPPLRFERRGSGWESFQCSCGMVVQLSPSFAGNTIQCSRCRRPIEITSQEMSEKSPTPSA